VYDGLGKCSFSSRELFFKLTGGNKLVFLKKRVNLKKEGCDASVERASILTRKRERLTKRRRANFTTDLECMKNGGRQHSLLDYKKRGTNQGLSRQVQLCEEKRSAASFLKNRSFPPLLGGLLVKERYHFSMTDK